MIKITREDLVKYLYNETSESKTASIKAALETDWDLRESFEILAKSKENLNTIKFSPRVESVNKILEYAAQKRMPVS